jgi:hypothetical protein
MHLSRQRAPTPLSTAARFPAPAPGHSRIDTGVSWRPVVRRQRFPRAGPRVKWAPSEQALLHAFPPPLLWNFGWAYTHTRMQAPALPTWQGAWLP